MLEVILMFMFKINFSLSLFPLHTNKSVILHKFLIFTVFLNRNLHPHIQAKISNSVIPTILPYCYSSLLWT